MLCRQTQGLLQPARWQTQAWAVVAARGMGNLQQCHNSNGHAVLQHTGTIVLCCKPAAEELVLVGNAVRDLSRLQAVQCQYRCVC